MRRKAVHSIFIFFLVAAQNFAFGDDKSGKQPTIRWLIRRDMPEVMQIENSSFANPWDEETILSHLRKRNIIGTVAEVDHKVVGFMIYELNRGKLSLLRFAVAPNSRREHIGTQMLQRLIDKLVPPKRTEINLEVPENNLSAQLFLSSLGFSAAVTSQQPKNADHSHTSPIQFSYRLTNGAIEGPIEQLSDEELNILMDRLTQFGEAPPHSTETKTAEENRASTPENSSAETTASTSDPKRDRFLRDLYSSYTAARQAYMIGSVALNLAGLYGFGDGLGAEFSPLSFGISGILAFLATKKLTQGLNEVFERSLLTTPNPENRDEKSDILNGAGKQGAKTGAIQGLCLVALQRLAIAISH